MTRNGFAAAVALLTIAVAGCGEKTADYTSLLTTNSTPPTTSTSPEDRVTIAQYLENVGVVGQQVAPDKLTDLTVTMPKPKGWEQYSNANLAPGTDVIAKGNTYPTAMLMVFLLSGADFDPRDAIKHADVDAEMSENFRKLNGSADDFHGFPSSMIEGSYDLNGSRMHTYNRIVFATGSPPANQRYLIQFTVTGYADKAAEEAPDIESIIAGFNVAEK